MKEQTYIKVLAVSVVLLVAAAYFLARPRVNQELAVSERNPGPLATVPAAEPDLPAQPIVIGPTLLPKEDWPMFHGNQRLTGLAGGAAPAKLKRLWRFKTEGYTTGPPAIAGGIVYFGSQDGGVYAVRLTTAEKVWHFKTDDKFEAAPLVIDGSVVIGSTEGNLYCLEVATGKQRWKCETGGKIIGGANFAREGDKTLILIGSYDGSLYCLDFAGGKAQWTFKTDNYVNGTPAVLPDGHIAFGGCDSKIHVLTPAGAELGDFDAGSYLPNSLAVDGNKAYAGLANGKVICADLKARGILWTWQAQAEATETENASSVALAGGRLVIGADDDRVYCLKTDGAPDWSFVTHGHVRSSPVICGDSVIVGSNDGRLYVLNLNNGQERWSYEIGEPVGSPAVGGGVIAVGSEDGYIYVFGEDP